MIDTVYVEQGVRDHPRTRRLLARHPQATVIPCERYGEIFNRHAQSFRLQKQRPALILAEKQDGFVLPTPEACRLGSPRNYYFSHLFNCVYDCRYCFLQGMYRSAHYVLFVNYEDFWREIQETSLAAPGTETMFFSGFDCDSLALEPTTRFVDFFLPRFETLPDAWFELRTKSVNLRVLDHADPAPRTVVAYSLSPETVAKHVEHQAPSVSQRIAALGRLADRGWNVGLRLDPVILHDTWQAGYRTLIEDIFARVPAHAVHSASVGPLRFPRDMFKAITREYPEEPLFAGPLSNQGPLVSYGPQREEEIADYLVDLLSSHMDTDRIFVANWDRACT